MPNYYEDWRTDEFDCPACKWRGPGSALSQGALTLEYFELRCPGCDQYITLVMNPTVEESRANWNKLSDLDRQLVEVVEHRRADFEHRKLREPSQLPDIDSPSFTLDWDFSDDGTRRETLIKHGETTMFTEPAVYEGYERYIEVAEILRARYGRAIRDLVPTDRSGLYLYGDRLASLSIVAAARKRIFSNEPGEQPGR